MKYILMQLTAYDCGQEYELDDYSVLLETMKRGDGDDEQAIQVISNYLKVFYGIDELPDSVIDRIRKYRLSDESVSIFDVDSEYHELEYMEMVHIEVEWQYIDVYKERNSDTQAHECTRVYQ